MKQTAVEWLANEFYEKLEVKGDGALFNDLVNQAKEMEKQQQGYSEEEVIAFGEFIFKHSLLTHTRGVKSLFETFKNK